MTVGVRAAIEAALSRVTLTNGGRMDGVPDDQLVFVPQHRPQVAVLGEREPDGFRVLLAQR